MTGLEQTLLGKQQQAPEEYAPDILFPISRDSGRKEMAKGLLEKMEGEDCWQAFELSWLDSNGMPQIATARFTFPANSASIVESKSLKLYLNSLNHHRIASVKEFVALLKSDLSVAAGCEVGVELFMPSDPVMHTVDIPTNLSATCLDKLSLDSPVYQLDPGLLRFSASNADREIEEFFSTDLFRSSCPVTGQPDWATVLIRYNGRPIDHQSLLAYLVSFRQHQGFHEQCVEQIFSDMMQAFSPAKLLVQAKFLRRGGLDISPLRFAGYEKDDAIDARLLRQ